MHGSVRYQLVLLVLWSAAFGAASGCSRKFFREYADKDVAGVITQKNKFPDWTVKNWHVYPDPRARFADPYNPDRPPYPPDDFAARALSPNPQHPSKKTGTGRYDGDGYLTLLQQWDLENRSAEDPAAARGAPPERLFLPRPSYITNSVETSHHGKPETSILPKSELEPAIQRTPQPKLEVPEVGPWVAAKSPLTPFNSSPNESPGTNTNRSVVTTTGLSKPVDLVTQATAMSTTQPPTLLPDTVPIPIAPENAESPQPNPFMLPGSKQAQDNANSSVTNNLSNRMSYGDEEYLRALQTNQQGYRIKVQQAVELGLINSREFQDRREDLYIAALPVTLERYNFAAQAFFTEQVIRRSTGSRLADAGQLWQLDTDSGLLRRFPTGAQLLIQLANQIVIDLGSDQPNVAVSNLALSLFQPFLRGGGFAVNLEGLTQSERNMLYAMRSYARFRKLFYVATVAGSAGRLGLTNNPYGLQGLSVNLGRGIGGNLTAPVVGFYPLLQQAAIIANQMKNVSALEQLLRQYQAFREGGQIADLQAGQVEVQLLQSRGNLLGQGGAGAGGGGGIRGYLDALDNFKLQLGLPMTVALDLDSSPLKPIRDQLARFEAVYSDLQELEAEARQYDPSLPADQFRPRWRRLLTESKLLKGTAFSQGIAQRWDIWARRTDDQVTAELASLRKLRAELLDRKAERERLGQPDLPEDLKRLAQIESELDLGTFEQAVRTYEARPWLKEKGQTAAGLQATAARNMFNAFYQLALEGRNERLLQTRRQWPELPSLPVNGIDVLAAPLDEAYTAGIQSALSNRLDLMNARGQVVDAYRQIAVQANSLQGVFDVRYDLNATSPPGENTPFAFAPDRTRHQLTLRAELPLVRRAERNNYRASLIGYQRQRRTLMAFEDNIANDVRSDIRALRTIAELYKIQQRVVELGYSQVDNARETFFAPLAANQVVDPGASAALTQQLLDAQNRLLNAQNTLYTYWVSYLTARMNLYLDLELMQIDERGVWIDEQAPGINDPAGSSSDQQPGERLPLPQPVGPADRR